MAQEFNLDDLKRHRQAKKRKRFLKKLLWVLIIIALGAAIFLTREKWLPFFDGIKERAISVTDNSGELAEGQFPIKVSGGTDYQVCTMENSIAVLNDTHFYVYSDEGQREADKQHTYANPILKANRKKALIYDIGGKGFRLESKNKTVYEKTADDLIVFARLSSNDYAAVVTKNDKVNSVVSIYNGAGEFIYRWNCVDYIMDVAFTNSGDGFVVSVLDSSGGQLVSKLYRFRFDMDKEVWSTPDADTMVMSMEIRDDSSVVAFGDTKCVFYSRNGEMLGSYSYETDLKGFSDSGKLTALAFYNEQRRKSKLVIVGNPAEDPVILNFNDEIKQVYADGEFVYTMMAEKIIKYSESGTVISEVPISDEYPDFHKLGNHIFLLGYSEIDRIDFK